MKSLSPLLRVVAVVLSLCFLAGQARAVDGSWIGSGSKPWSDGANWFSGTVAGGVGSVVDFTRNITASQTITLETTPRTVGILNIGDNDWQYILLGGAGGNLIFDNGASAAQLNYVAATGATVQIKTPFVLNSSLVISNSSSFEQSTSSLVGGISAGTSGTKTISLSAGKVTISGTISNGAGVVAVEQNSANSVLTLTIVGNSYSGNTTLSAGRLRVGQNNVLGTGTLIFNGGTLSTSGATGRSTSNTVRWDADTTLGDVGNVDNGYLILSGSQALTGNRVLNVVSNTVTLSGAIGDGGNGYGLTKSGSATLKISGLTTYTGGTVVNEGTLLLGANNRFVDTGIVTINNGSIFDMLTFNDTVGLVTLNSGTIAATGATSGGILTGSGYNVYEGAISARLAGASSVLTKSGTGTVTLSGSTSYGGGTVINQGRLLLSGSGKLAAAGAVTVGGGTFDLGTLSSTVGAVTISSGTITNGVLTGSSYAGSAGTISAQLSGTAGLTKSGTGRLVLSASNSYTGATNVNGGTLIVNGQIASSSTVTVNTATLQGSGTIGGALRVLSGGTLAPGNSTGNLTADTATLGEFGTLQIEINDATGVAGSPILGWDLLTLSSGVNITATVDAQFTIQVLSLNASQQTGLALNFDPSLSYEWLIVDTATPIALFDPAMFLVDAGGFQNENTGIWSIVRGDTIGQSSSDLYLTYAIPEPSTWALIMGGMTVMMIFRRRRNGGAS